MKPELLRALPKMDLLLARPALAGSPLPYALRRQAARQVLDEYRAALRAGALSAVPGLDELEQSVLRRGAELARPALGRVINATGVVLHTNLGRAPLSPRAAAAVGEAARGYSNLEYDLSARRRGRRGAAVESLLCALTGAEAWADVCCFSGDKLLGGPQAGILLGKAEPLGRLRADPLFRALRPGKLALAALEATLLDWRDGTAVPVSAMLSAPPEELRRRAEALAEALSPLHPCTAVETAGEVGGGARPGESLPAWAAALEPAEALEAHLRAWRVPILGRIHRGKLLLDVRTLLPGDEAEIAAALAAWREERA